MAISVAIAAASVLAMLYFGPIVACTAEPMVIAMLGVAFGGAAISARRKATVVLADRVDRLSRAIDAAPEAWLILAPNGRIDLANSAFDRLFAARTEAPLDRIERAVWPDGDSAAQFRRLCGHAAAGVPGCASLGLSRTAPAGVAGRFQITVNPIAGHPGYSLWSIRDITAPDDREPAVRCEQQAALRSPERFRRCFANAPIGIALLDRRGRFEEANRAVGKLLGATPKHLTGQELTGFLSEEDRDRIGGKLAAAANGDADPVPIEVRPKQPGDKAFFLYLGRLDDTGDGSPCSDPILGADPDNGLTLHFIDVTEQRNLEMQVAQSQKMQAIGQLAGGVAHDFNNLLTAMIGFCDLLLLRSPPGDPAFADIMQIKQNANRAANLVRQLLAFSRQQTLQPRVLDITDILYELRHLLERLIGENIRLDVVHGRDLGLVKVDQGQFEQVIINLAVNARDAMPGGGALTIRTANRRQGRELRRGHEVMPAGDYVLIELADTGVGIPKENLGRIFDPFFSTKELGSGTGLGLSTVYGIVKQTGGFVFVTSSPRRGTVFEIYLPRCEAADGTPPVRLEAGEPLAPKDLTGQGRIMLVEDDDPVRIFGARALRNKGYLVTEATSGEAALEIIRNTGERFDLLISDVVMPNMDGPALVREIREIHRDIRVIFISGYTEDAFRQRLDSDGGIDFLPKPFSLKQLAAEVRRVLSAGTA